MDSFSLFDVSSVFSSETSESVISEDCSSDVTDEASDDVFSEEVVEDVGINGKMNEFQAAMGLENLKIYKE